MSSPEYCGDAPLLNLPPDSTQSQSRWLFTRLERSFWIFFAAALFLDFGFDLYFFLYNLFLVSIHYDERAIGIISSALTVGNVAGTIPASMIAGKFGLQKPLLFCFLAAPIICIVRPFAPSMAAQVVFAFLTGVALCSWPVCFAPTVAKLTTDDTRVFAFSITFATGIGTGMLAGFAGGYLPALSIGASSSNSLAGGMRFVLIGASLVAMLGAVPISRLKIAQPAISGPRRTLILHPFLLRFLPVFALWSIVTGSFAPFAPVYFQKHLGFSLQHVGAIFSAAELVQFSAVLLVPFLYRRIGTTGGILLAQAITAAAAVVLGRANSPSFAVTCYMVLMGAQFTAGPGFYGMLMSRMSESDHNGASAMQNITGALSGAAASSLTGILIVRSGYGSVFRMSVTLTIVSALLALILLNAPTSCRNQSAGPL